MDKKLRKIDHKGDTYISSEDLRELLEDINSIDELREAIFPTKEKPALSDFNQKLVKGLGFNPNENLDKVTLKDCQKKLPKYKYLENTAYKHNSGSHSIIITDVNCFDNGNGYYISCIYKNVETGITGENSYDFIMKNYSLDPLGNL